MRTDATNARTRRLLSLRPAKRQLKPVPAPLPPTAIQTSYYSKLKTVICDRARAEVRKVQGTIIADLIAQRAALAVPKGDNRKPSGKKPHRSPVVSTAKAKRLLDEARASFEKGVDTTALRDVVKEFGRRTDKHQRAQLDRQLRSAVGIGYGAIEKPIRDAVPVWVDENVDLIKTVPERYFGGLGQDVEAAYASGMQPATLAKVFEQQYETSKSNARRIARDQITKLGSKVERERQINLGVEQWTWGTARDGDVCDICESMAGQTFSYSDPPPEGEPGDCHVNDRCYRIPDLSPLLA